MLILVNYWCLVFENDGRGEEEQTPRETLGLLGLYVP